MRNSALSIVLTAFFLSVIFFWKKVWIFGLAVNFHALALVALLVITSVGYRDSKITRQQVLFVLFSAFYLSVIAAYVPFDDGTAAKFFLRTSYTFLLILIFSVFIGVLGVRAPSVLGASASVAVILALPTFIVLGLDVSHLAKSMWHLDLSSADQTWRKLYAKKYFEGLQGVVNLRNPLSAVLAIVCGIALMSDQPRLRVAAIIISSLMIASLISMSGTLIFETILILHALSHKSNQRYTRFLIAVIVLVSIPSASLILNAGTMAPTDSYSKNRIEGTTVQRLEHIVTGWRKIEESNYLGFGPGTKIATEYGEVYPHNMFITVWLNLGPAGVMLYTAFYIVLLLSFSVAVRGVLSGELSYAACAASILVFCFLLRALVSGAVVPFCDFSSALAVGLVISSVNGANGRSRIPNKLL